METRGWIPSGGRLLGCRLLQRAVVAYGWGACEDKAVGPVLTGMGYLFL